MLQIILASEWIESKSTLNTYPSAFLFAWGTPRFVCLHGYPGLASSKFEQAVEII